MGSQSQSQSNNMKVVLYLSFFVISTFAQDVVNESTKKGDITVDTRAPSDYQNCKCQCDSYTWSDGKYTRGNCKSKARLPGKYTSATGLFCYVSGSALCACRDVQVSKSVTDSFGRPRYYSFEACTTPPKNQCYSYGNNFGMEITLSVKILDHHIDLDQALDQILDLDLIGLDLATAIMDQLCLLEVLPIPNQI